MEAKLHVHGTVIIANNTASQSGGGIYLYKSEMTPCQTISALKLSGNTTMEKGGGIYAVGSLIKAKVPTVKNLIQKYSMIYLVTVVHS